MAEMKNDVAEFTARLEGAAISYRVDNVRPGSTMFCIAVPGERWEVEFLEDGTSDIEIFRSDGTILGKEALDVLFSKFAG
ncbi:hypothetical protein LRS13_15070 [Svornostia abyssi]|uniref:Uncharacterized protein n=1 Tax=Svornostia abyssi TaxID=2898438 RepID=A0ABY5PBI4_9ACTN|nr:hypothetical protein LRS13_15070 [Parviterribacteraceae bacterium J379]